MSKMGASLFVNSSQKWYLITSAVFFSVEVSWLVAKTQGEGLTQRCVYQETTSSGAILEDSYHIKAEQDRNSRVI